MIIQVRRGLEANRTAYTPQAGEPIFTTDEKKLYVGDGTTPGGILVDMQSGVQTIVAGTDISVDATDPANPIVSFTGESGGAVTSVNGLTGVVVLDADDISDASTTNKFATAAEKTKLANITVTQAVDLDTIETNANNVPGIKTKTDHITVTQAVNLDTMESDIAAKQPLDPDLTAIAALDSATAGALVTDGAGWIRKTYAQLKTALGLVKADVGLGNVDNIQQQPLDADLTALAAAGNSTVLANTTASFLTADETKLDGIEALADVTDAGNVGAAIHGASAKTTPVDADTMGLIDSAASNVLKKLSWANVKATLKTYFDTLYQPIATVLTNTTASFTTALETKLNGIETAADVTDAANVAAAGATMDADTSLAGNGYFLDEDNFASNSATKVPSQQSTKAYVDAQVAGGGGVVDAIVAGNNIDVDSTDPANPIVSVEALTPADIGLAASVTELDYVDGVTSAIQTQLDAKQALDADLTSWAAITRAAGFDTFVATPSGANLASLLTTALSASKGGTGLTALSANIVSLLGAADYAAVRTLLGLVIGTNVQAWDADLDTIAGLTPTTDNFMVGTASAWASRTPTQARSQMGLGSLATLSTINGSNWSGQDLAVADGGTGASTLTGILLGNGTSAITGLDAGVLSAVRFYTADGTWTKPAGLRFIVVECRGGGGGGGGVGTTSGTGTGGGGGQGEYVISKIAAASLASTETVDVGGGGAGGVGNATGTTGSTTNFGTTPIVIAIGGSGGAGSTGAVTSRPGGIGGTGGTGNFAIPGCPGHSSTPGTTGNGGGEGGGVGHNSNAAGNAGARGGGGSGALDTGTTSRNGGAGGAGTIIIREYF